MCNRAVAVMFALIVQVVVVVASAAAQPETVRIPYRVSCAGCRIEMVKLATIGGADHGDEIAPSLLLARDSRGRYYSLGLGRTSFLVFDSTGKYLTTFGREGQGPGEITRTTFFYGVGPGDSLYVVDAGSRLSVFSPSHVFVRMVRLSGSRQQHDVLADSRILVGGALRSPGQVGYPFHLLHPDGRPLMSFGTPVEVRPTGSAPLTSEFRLSDTRESLWHWRPDRYRFEEWGLDGKKRADVEVLGIPGWTAPGADPFKDMSDADRMKLMTDTAALRAMQPRLAAAAGSRIIFLRASIEGHLWIYRGPTPQSGRLGQAGPVIDVIDVRNKAVLTTYPLASTPRFFAGSDLAITREIGSDGVVTVTVWRMRLVGAGRN